MWHSPKAAIALIGLAIAACVVASAQVVKQSMAFAGGCWAIMEKPGSDRQVAHFRLLPKGPWQEGPDRRNLVGRVPFIDGRSINLKIEGDGSRVVMVKDGKTSEFTSASANEIERADGSRLAEFKSLALGELHRISFIGNNGKDGLSVTIHIGDAIHTVHAVRDGCD